MIRNEILDFMKPSKRSPGLGLLSKNLSEEEQSATLYYANELKNSTRCLHGSEFGPRGPVGFNGQLIAPNDLLLSLVLLCLRNVDR